MLSKLQLLVLRNHLLHAAAVAAVVAYNYGTVCCVLLNMPTACWLSQRWVITQAAIPARCAARAAASRYIANTHNLITAYAIDEATHHSSGRNGRAQTAS